MRSRAVRLLCRAALLLGVALAPVRVLAQACPAGQFCFYVPPGLPLESSHSTAASRSFDIVLSSPVRSVAASYSVSGGPLISITIAPGASQRIPLSGSSGPASAYQSPEVEGVLVVADSPNLTVDHRETFDQEQYSETIKQSGVALGTRFRLAGYSLNLPSTYSAGMDAVVVFAPTGAVITLTAPPGATLPFWTGSPTATLTRTLTAGQTLAVRTVLGQDIDGALLTSSAPVAASSGGRGWSQQGCGDDGMDGLVPTSALGREHALRLPSGSSLTNGESRVRVVADVDSTEVRINGALVATLSAGAFYTFQPTALSYVQTSQPALVWMNGSLNGCELDTVLIPPIAFAPALTDLSLDFSVLASTQTPSAELAILIATSQVSSIRLDSAVPTFISTDVVPGRADLTYVRFNVSPGDHNVRAGADFQAMLATRTQPSGLLAYYNPYRIPGCGDSAVDPGEGCDDGNLNDGDGCSQTCTIEPGYGCTGIPSVCVVLCGNGAVSAPLESCDDGNTTAGDGCNVTCRREVSLEAPIANAILNVSAPVVTGIADPGASVNVVFGASSGTAVADAQGAWSFSSSVPPGQGLLTITATATDLRGGVSSATRSVSIDTSTSIRITQPAANSTVSTARPEIVGSGESGALVALSIDGMAAGTAVVDSQGQWRVQLSTPLANGLHSVTADSQDVSGNLASATSDFRVDVRTDPLVLIHNVPDGAYIQEPRPLFSGSANPGAEVVVTMDGVTLDMLTATWRGSWRFQLINPLTPGPHTLRAETADALGRIAVDQHTFTFNPQTTPVAIIAPIAGNVVRDATPVISGTTAAGATVQVAVDGQVIGQANVDANGAWTLEVTSPLSEGRHVVTVLASGVEANPGTVEVGFYVDTMTAVDIRYPAAGAKVGTPLPTIVGRAEPGAIVRVSVDGVVVGEADVAIDGSWLLPLNTPLTAGEHGLRADATDRLGNGARDEQTFIYDPISPDSDGDGRLDAEECTSSPCQDSDGDGNTDEQDADDDGDGLPTVRECSAAPCPDSDGDSKPDYLDPDDDDDGRPTAEELASDSTPRDTDYDGIPDHLDVDDDDDGATTRVECASAPCPDTDGDGVPDWLDPDDDNDRLPSDLEHADSTRLMDDDFDDDGVVNWLDPDANENGVDDGTDGRGDQDGDDTPDYLDPDVSVSIDRASDISEYVAAGGGGCSAIKQGSSAWQGWLLPGLALLIARRRRRRLRAADVS